MSALASLDRRSENVRVLHVGYNGEGMTTPQQRLARMCKSIAKNRSVLTEDYKYFTTPDKPTKRVKYSRRSAPKSQKRR